MRQLQTYSGVSAFLALILKLRLLRAFRNSQQPADTTAAESFAPLLLLSVLGSHNVCIRDARISVTINSCTATYCRETFEHY